MSSESQEYSSPNLYCNEASDEIFLSQKYANLDCDNSPHTDSNSLPYEESSIVNAFDSEVDQVLDSDMIRRFMTDPRLVSDRLEAVNWIIKVHGYYHFQPETAYLSVNYLDRFLLSTKLPKGKTWPFQLLSVACLSLAAKMEEVRVPLLLDLQTKESHRFLFKPKTVQRMELMVMAILKWRLRTATPFDFVHYFVAKLSLFGLIKLEHCNTVISHTSDIIVLTCQVIDFLDYLPSTITAAAVLCAADQDMDDDVDDDRISRCFHQRLSRERVRKCYSLIKQSICLLPPIKRPKLIQPSPSPVGVLDAAISENCDGADFRVARI